jgi:hypothetical protein
MALQSLRSAIGITGDPAPVNAEAGAPADPMTAGSIDAEVHGCPGCGRTIPKGSRRCDGCGMRLLRDVPARTASMFLGAGVLAGFVAGAALMAVTAPRQPDPAAAVTPAGALPAGATAIPLDVATNGLAALRGTTTLNGRLAAEAGPLARAVGAKKVDVADVVAILRRMSADTRAASAMVGSLDIWPAAATQQAALSSFYASLSAELNEGLSASVKSAKAYRASAERVLGILAQVPALDAASRALATEIGAELPAVTIPEALVGG